ncbi:zinc finger protein 62 [Elysia marginata]|uniref:Zinc finger protein 62 n=1 Tax=Elysia marginata TaxID=1093978 RepID=A0AAV4FXK4_9GAST|nr:zinc finger protein 62 [Elysia marginata]
MASIHFIEIQEGVRAFYSTLSGILPDVESFQKDVDLAQPLLSFSQFSQLSSLCGRLVLLQSQAGQMKSDVAEMKKTMQRMLNDNINDDLNFFSYSYTIPATKFETLDGEDNTFKNSRHSPCQIEQFATQTQLQSIEGLEFSNAESPNEEDWKDDTFKISRHSPGQNEQFATQTQPQFIEGLEFSNAESPNEEGATELENPKVSCQSDDKSAKEPKRGIKNVVERTSKQHWHIKSQKCYWCGKKISRRKEHMQKYHPEKKNFRCESCGEEFDDYKDFRNHRKLTNHTGAPVSKCDLCNKTLKSIQGVVKHMKSHVFEKKHFLCQVCGKSFKDEQVAANCRFKCIIPTDDGTKFQQLESSTNTYGSGMQKFIRDKSKEHVIRDHRGKCYVCGMSIGSRRNLHMQKYHPGQKYFPCKICGMEFDDFKEFRIHRKTHTIRPIIVYKCDLCNRRLKSMKYLKEHIRKHCNEKQFLCPVCGRSYKYKTYVARCKHKRPHRRSTDKTSQECDTCGKIFTVKSGLMTLPSASLCKKCSDDNYSKFLSTENNEELQTRHGSTQQKFSCSLCDKKFRTFWLFKQHLNVHQGVKPYECEVCHKRFHTYIEKKKHKHRLHCDKYTGLSCKICGERCRSHIGRESHYLNHSPEELAQHGIVVKMSECDVCGKTMRKSYLCHHKKQHHSAKGSFICEVCGKGFKNEYYFIRHKNECEPREKDHVCNVCGRNYSRKYYLTIHYQRMHAGFNREPAYLCDICGKSFTVRYQLQAHKVVHTKAKPFSCRICHKTFSWETSLNRHYLAHTEKKRFKCEFCSKSFHQKSALVTHRRIHTGEKPYLCTHCGKRFYDSSTLIKHKMTHVKS